MNLTKFQAKEGLTKYNTMHSLTYCLNLNIPALKGPKSTLVFS